MSYTISPGMSEDDLSIWLKSARQRYGTYRGKSINYKHADLAPIVMCAVVVGDEILLVKRGHSLSDASGYWSLADGFIDQEKPITHVAQLELKEELGLIVERDVIKLASSYTLHNPKEKRKYIVFPCLVQLDAKPAINLDYENTEFAWVKREDISCYEILDDLLYAVDQALVLQSHR